MSEIEWDAETDRIGRLVLSRKVGERLQLLDTQTGLEIWVTLVEVLGRKARLLVEAPVDVRVAREELLTKGEDR